MPLDTTDALKYQILYQFFPQNAVRYTQCITSFAIKILILNFTNVGRVGPQSLFFMVFLGGEGGTGNLWGPMWGLLVPTKEIKQHPGVVHSTACLI